MKRCPKCCRELTLSDFPKSKWKKSGLFSYCKQCCVKRSQVWRKENPGKYKDYHQFRKARARKLIREYLVNKCCQHCGESDPIVLQFHHLKDKTTTVGNLVSDGRKWETILKEIAKCEILCANCHFKQTAKDLGRFDYL